MLQNGCLTGAPAAVVACARTSPHKRSTLRANQLNSAGVNTLWNDDFSALMAEIKTRRSCEAVSRLSQRPSWPRHFAASGVEASARVSPALTRSTSHVASRLTNQAIHAVGSSNEIRISATMAGMMTQCLWLRQFAEAGRRSRSDNEDATQTDRHPLATANGPRHPQFHIRPI